MFLISVRETTPSTLSLVHLSLLLRQRTVCFHNPCADITGQPSASWIREHAFQTDKMLLGRSEIVGFFFCGTSDTATVGTMQMVVKKFLRGCNDGSSCLLLSGSYPKLFGEDWVSEKKV